MISDEQISERAHDKTIAPRSIAEIAAWFQAFLEL